MRRRRLIPGFSKKYNVIKLVYYESLDSEDDAERREIQLKKRSRAYKINLIERRNIGWMDLFEDL